MATITGTNGPNRLAGTSAADILRGLAGNDSLSGLAGNDRLDGGTGNDRLDGGAGADVMDGGSGNDVYVVDRAGDRVIEAAGRGIDLVQSGISYTLGVNVENLTLTGSAAIGGTGNSVNNVITGNAGANVLRGLLGGDTLFGGGGSDTLVGAAGNDRLAPGAGNGVRDVINGGAGVDTLDYSDARASVEVYVATAFAARAAALDVITGMENVVGSAFGDRLQSGAGGAFFLASGGGGDDIIFATPETYDRVRGDAGYDRLHGHIGGPDDFWLQYNRGIDVVADFRNADSDHVVLSRREFNLATPAGQFLRADELETSFFAHDAGSPRTRLIHETSSGVLWADKDGSGPAAAIPIAVFQDNVSLLGQIFVFA
jgi:Ca2+-binding RTX toxin-like protein